MHLNLTMTIMFSILYDPYESIMHFLLIQLCGNYSIFENTEHFLCLIDCNTCI